MEALKAKLGEAYWQSKEFEDDPAAPRVVFVPEETIGELEGGIAGGFFFLGSYVGKCRVEIAAFANSQRPPD